MAIAEKRCAAVTGGNKGIGLEICRKLATQGIMVVLTARDEKKGTEALERLKHSGLSENLVFHRLDVLDQESIAGFFDFIKSRFEKLDILVNNAGIIGANADVDALKASGYGADGPGGHINWEAILDESYELAVECLETNYCGAKRMIQAFLPLLHLSDAPRIVNVSSSMGKLKNINNAWAKGVLTDVQSLTEERVDEVLNEFLKDFREGSLQAKGWPSYASAYAVSKAAMNAYTRILARKHGTFRVNCVCPGFVKTDINFNTGKLTAEEGAEFPVKLAVLPDDGPSGLFFFQNGVSSF